MQFYDVLMEFDRKIIGFQVQQQRMIRGGSIKRDGRNQLIKSLVYPHKSEGP